MASRYPLSSPTEHHLHIGAGYFHATDSTFAKALSLAKTIVVMVRGSGESFEIEPLDAQWYWRRAQEAPGEILLRLAPERVLTIIT